MNSNETSIFGIVITCAIVGTLVIVVLVPMHPISAIYGCGSTTFYHSETNSCELFPPIDKNQIKLSSSLVSLMSDTNFDNQIKFDENGYAKGKCAEMSGSNWHMDKWCVITLD